MPSKINSTISSIQLQIDTLNKKISEITVLNQIINKITKIEKPPIYGLTNLIKNKLPTFSGWDTDPTDAGNITDDDPSTICTTGTVAAAAWQTAYIEWDLGGTYTILMTGMGRIITDANSGYIYDQVYDGSAWRPPRSYCAGANGSYGTWTVYSGTGTKVRLEFISTGICNFSPYVSMFSVWKLK